MQKGEKDAYAELTKKILNAEKMTPERLRTFPGFEEIDDQQANHVIETLQRYCQIIVKHVSKE